MATRALIKIEDSELKDIAVYKHFDGYPEATLPWLEYFHKKFLDNRGWDPQYEFAQLLRSSAWDAAKFNLDNSKETGWGVVNTAVAGNLSAEYLYILKKTGIEIKYFNWDAGEFVTKEEIEWTR